MYKYKINKKRMIIGEKNAVKLQWYEGCEKRTL